MRESRCAEKQLLEEALSMMKQLSSMVTDVIEKQGENGSDLAVYHMKDAWENTSTVFWSSNWLRPPHATRAGELSSSGDNSQTISSSWHRREELLPFLRLFTVMIHFARG